MVIFLTLALLTSCNNTATTKTATTKSITEREGAPDVHNVESSDLQMNKAILEANLNMANFKKALLSENDDYQNFSIKQKFDTQDGGGEHIWIQEIKIIDTNYFGTVSNQPLHVDAIKFGDAIKVDKNKISDWMYLDKGVVQGAYTVRLLRNEMTEEERKQFDIELFAFFFGHFIS